MIQVKDLDMSAPAQSSTDEFENRLEMLVSLEGSLEERKPLRSTALSELARLCFLLGEAADPAEQHKWYEKGRGYAELLRGEEPGRVEGYYWLALNSCGLCETVGAGRALRLLPEIVENLKSAAGIDGTYDQAGPFRVLGRIRFKAPSWPISEGDLVESLHLLRLAVKTAPNNSTNRLYLAETLAQLNKTEEACRELDVALAITSNALTSRQLKEDQEQAIALRADCGDEGRTAPGRAESLALSTGPDFRQVR